MRWEGEKESSNVEDRRGQGGGGFRLPIPGGGGGRRGGGIGIGTIVIVVLAAWLFGINPLTLLGMFSGIGPVTEEVMPREQAMPRSPTPGGVPQAGRPGPAPQDPARSFVSVVLASTEEVWGRIFEAAGSRYPAPTLVLYSGATQTACGAGNAAAGPFYCPADRKVYIDLSFYRTLRDRLGAPGDTAQAYVIAHEVGHHIQNLTGTMQKMESARARMGERQYNELSVRLELQADCYAGVWAHHSQRSRNWFEQGDIEEALNAAAAVGDDHIQRQTQGTVVPDAFTHGTSAQRSRWFRAGMQSGSIDQCDTFSVRTP
ncbi:MAG: neutral zinc metallopeptidase [Lautropia sp.]